MRSTFIAMAVVAAAQVAFARDMPIYNGKLTSALNAGGFAITNLPAPTASGDAVNKGYVDGIGGVTPQTVTNIAEHVVSTDVAPWAMAGKEKPQGITTQDVSAIISSDLNKQGDTYHITVLSAVSAQSATTADSATIASTANSADMATSAINATFATTNTGDLAWGQVKMTPTTVEGYGITDAATSSDIVTAIAANEKTGETNQIVRGEYGGGAWHIWVGNAWHADYADYLGSSYPYLKRNQTTNRWGWEDNGDFRPFAYTSELYNDYLAGLVATNTFAANADYALTNLTGATVSLASGHIGNLTLGSETSNLTVNLDFSSSPNRSGDAMLYLVNAADTYLAIGPAASVTPIGYKASDAMKAGTNIVLVTRMAYEGGKSVVNVAIKEVK